MRTAAASLADLEALTTLFAAYLKFYNEEKQQDAIQDFLAARLQAGDSTVFIARDDADAALGFVQLYPFFASLALAPAWLLSDLYVAERARRQGVGEALMQAARAHAEATGACCLMLETAKTNLAGQALYERLGYVRDDMFYTYWLGLTRAATE